MFWCLLLTVGVFSVKWRFLEHDELKQTSGVAPGHELWISLKTWLRGGWNRWIFGWTKSFQIFVYKLDLGFMVQHNPKVRFVQWWFQHTSEVWYPLHIIALFLLKMPLGCSTQSETRRQHTNNAQGLIDLASTICKLASNLPALPCVGNPISKISWILLEKWNLNGNGWQWTNGYQMWVYWNRKDIL